jgi:small-conductance mechanosensitive channel
MRSIFSVFHSPARSALVFLILLACCSIARGAGAPPPSIDGDSVLRYLDRCIDWYQRVNALDQTDVNSQELLFRQSAVVNARESLQKAFLFARAQAAIIDSQSSGSKNSAASAGTTARLKQAAAAADQRVADLKNQLNDSYHTARTPADAAQQSKLAAELNLATTQRDALAQYAGFMVSSSGGPQSLSDKIDALEQTVPEINASAAADSAKAPTSAVPPAQTQEFHPESAGLITLVSELFTLTGRMSELKQLSTDADNLKKDVDDQLRPPFRARWIDDTHRAMQLAATTQESTDPKKLDADRRDIDALTTDIKLTTSAGIPLGEQSILLAVAGQSLSSWHTALGRQYAEIARSLLLRTLGTALVIIILIIVSELWRRATFRYISDPRRRRQFMLVRRIVIGAIVVLIIIASVVTEFGSLATFAGLITAGIAVALQTVILSGVAYFFFIGRFGVRVGDRVTVSGITGDVVEIGLFRLYLMELTGPVSDLHSTGRMIVFSNAVLFQPSAFYKQLPGAEYVWHEIALTLSPDTDHDLAEQRLMAAVEAVFSEYGEVIERQREEANQILHIPLEEAKPKVRLRFVETGVELVIRYPVELSRASEIEDRLTRKLLDAIGQEPKLKMVATGTPKLQAVK